MNILLLGYGKMGKAIEKIALDRGNKVIEAVHDHGEVKSNPSSFDVAIEFSAPEAAFENIKFGLENGIPVVSGTTGWLDRLNEVKAIVDQMNGTFFYASNFSLGVNLFFRLNKELAKLMAKHDYRPEMEEIHHIHKLDAPSGTAITLAEGLIENQPDLEKWVNKRVKEKWDPGSSPGTSQKEKLPIFSIREGEVPGTHIITYRGEHDEIRIEHKAFSREGFALGAVEVAEWVIGKKGFLGMEDYLG